MAIVGSNGTSFGSACVEAGIKAAAFNMSLPEFRTAMRNRPLHPQIIPNSLCSCKDRPTFDVSCIHLQKCERFHRETLNSRDILNADLIQLHKSMGLLTYKINEDHFTVADPTCGLRGDQLVYKAGEMPLVIHVTASKVVTPGIKDKRKKPSTSVKVQSREVRKSTKYQDLFHAVDI